jgi:hypothetical protein
LLQPCRLCGNPQRQRRNPQPWVLPKRRGGKIDGQEDHVPEEVLASAHFVEGNKGEGLGHHAGGEILLGDGEWHEDGREGQLREEGEGFEFERREWEGRGKIEKNIVGGKIVAVVDAGYMVEVGVCYEGGAISVAMLVMSSSAERKERV